MEEDKNQRSSEESLKKLPRSPEVTIHWPCRVILTSPEATGDIGGASTELRPPFGGPSADLIFVVDVIP